MQKLGLALLAIFLGIAPAQAQPVTNPAPVGAAGAYNAVAPTCTTTNFCWFQLDVAGNLKIAGTGTAAGTSSTGAGIQAVGVMAQVDDTAPTAVAEDQFGNVRMSLNRSLNVKPYASELSSWTYAAAAAGIVNTTVAVTIRAATAANRNCITAIQLASDALGAATEVAIRDGAGGAVLWRSKIGTAGVVNGFQATFPSPVCGAAVNTLLEVVTLTASVTGAVYFNAQGYITP